MNGSPNQKADHLFPPFRDLYAAMGSAMDIGSYYEGVLGEFELSHVTEQTWDLPVYDEMVEYCDPRSVLNIACGWGRVLEHLSWRSRIERLDGVDVSQYAEREFNKRLGDGPARFVRHDITRPYNLADTYDLVAMSDLSVNAFAEETALCSVLEFMRDGLAADGHAVLMAFGDEVPKLFAAAPQAVDVLPFTDQQGHQRLIWRGIQFETGTQRLCHNYFVQSPKGDPSAWPGALAVEVERLWTESEVISMAERAGLTLTRTATTSVGGGGADGWPVSVLTFGRR